MSVSTAPSERDVEERSSRLQAESFVFDFSPHGEPIPRPAGAASALGAAGAGEDPKGVLRSLWAAHLRELEESPKARSRVAEIWRLSGVDAVQVTLGALELGLHDWAATLRDADHWRRREQVGDDIRICTTPAELRSAREAGRIGILLGLQDTLQLGTDLSRLEELHELGIRVVQLTYNRRNLVGDGCTERQQSGLSRLGVELVQELNRLGIVIDVSHSGIGTTNEAVELSDRPVAFTHTACRALYDHPRAKSDDQLRRLGEADGYVGIVAVPFFLARAGSTIDTMVDHVLHAAEIVGIERVGIATDWGFWSSDFPVELRESTTRAFQGASGFRSGDGLDLGVSLGDFARWEDWPALTAGLVRRGLADAAIRGLLGENWLRFLERAQEGRWSA
jgi:membrane dipeptidase